VLLMILVVAGNVMLVLLMILVGNVTNYVAIDGTAVGSISTLNSKL
jgi:hypothetical protein